MELLRGKDTQLSDDVTSDEFMGGDIKGRIPNPDSCRERGRACKAGLALRTPWLLLPVLTTAILFLETRFPL